MTLTDVSQASVDVSVSHDALKMDDLKESIGDIKKEEEVSDERKGNNATLPKNDEVPMRFLRAEKGDVDKGRKRYEETLEWRKENKMDEILQAEWKHFDLIKENWPHYFHLRGKKNEPVYYEMPPKMKLDPMRKKGLTIDDLLHHYALVTEFEWQYIESSEEGKSIYVVDLNGMGFWDFAGEIIDFCRKASKFTQQHYPERASAIFVINVPTFFQMIFNIMKPMADPVTLEKIKVVSGKEKVLAALKEKIDLENIPPFYGGTSVPLGEAPEEKLFKELLDHNNLLASGDLSCGGKAGGCQFCSFEVTPQGGKEFGLITS
jgi:hypothetical protein